MRLFLNEAQSTNFARNGRFRDKIDMELSKILKERWNLGASFLKIDFIRPGSEDEDMVKELLEVDHIKGDSTVDLSETEF